MSPTTQHREITPAAIGFGIAVGIVLNAALTYAALKVGVLAFSASAVAAVFAIGVLRNVVAQGTVLECNMVQSVATAIASPAAGIVFTLPVLYLLGVELGAGSELFWCMTLACVSGAILGCAFIIPLRRRMIDMQRLHFPAGRAVSEILRAPSVPLKARWLLAGCLTGALIYLPVVSSGLSLPSHSGKAAAAGSPRLPGYGDLAGPRDSATAADSGWISDRTIFLSSLLGDWAPRGWMLWFSISPLAFGAGYIAGRKGFLLALGGLLAGGLIAPMIAWLGHVPSWASAPLAGAYAHKHWHQPLGMGLLMGGAAVAALRVLPAACRDLRERTTIPSDALAERLESRDQLPWTVILASACIGMICLYAAIFYLQQARPDVQEGWLTWVGLTQPHLRALTVTLLGGAWIWLAGVVATETQSRLGWSPVAGIALLTVALVMLLTGPRDAAGAVLISAALCVAISTAGDLMQNQRTGQRLGANPAKQQAVHLFSTAIAPFLSIVVVFLIVAVNRNAYGAALGPGTATEAPQAQLLRDVIMGTHGPRAAPMAYYGLGGVMGGLLSLVSLPSMGLLAGLSLFLPVEFLLTFGLGAAAHELLRRGRGLRWADAAGGVFCAGLIVGESITALSVRLAALVSEVVLHA